MRRYLIAVIFMVLLGIPSGDLSTAFGAEWLLNGVSITTLTSAESIGTTVLEDAKLNIKLECKGTGIGSIGPNGEGEITEILEGGVATSLAKPLKCAPLGGCSSPVEDVSEGLPWHTKLIENAGKIEVELEKATYWFMCNVLGFLTEEECTLTKGKWPVSNGPSDVEVPSGTRVTPNTDCTVGGMGSGTQEFTGISLVAVLTGATLQVS